MTSNSVILRSAVTKDPLRLCAAMSSGILRWTSEERCSLPARRDAQDDRGLPNQFNVGEALGPPGSRLSNLLSLRTSDRCHWCGNPRLFPRGSFSCPDALICPHSPPGESFGCVLPLRAFCSSKISPVFWQVCRLFPQAFFGKITLYKYKNLPHPPGRSNT